MNEEIKIVFDDILISLHEACVFSVVMSILCTTIYMIIKECGTKDLIIKWKQKEKKYHLLLMVLCFYISLMLFRTLFNRDAWFNPFSNIIGVWGIHDLDGNITTEAIENIILFVPFSILLSSFFELKKMNMTNISLFKVILKVAFMFSLSLEIAQTIFRMGTFQLADIAYNIMGAVLGCLFYLVLNNISEIINKGKENKNEY